MSSLLSGVSSVEEIFDGDSDGVSGRFSVAGDVVREVVNGLVRGSSRSMTP